MLTYENIFIFIFIQQYLWVQIQLQHVGNN